jgi:hypothetical protein
MMPVATDASGSGVSVERWLDIALISAVSLLCFYYATVGFLGSDDAAYIGAARRWVHAIPPVSNFFGDLRYPVILPIAGSIMLFGDSETIVALPTLLYAYGTVLATYLGLRSLTNRSTALIAALLLAVSPLLAGWTTTVNDDTCELFFVAVSLFAFFHGTQHRKGWPVFFLSGVGAGLAFMTRESTVALLAFYGLLFLAGFGGRRGMFWIMAAGFAAVYCSEMSYYAIASGDPLHRLRLVMLAQGKPDPIKAIGAIDLSSGRTFNISPLVDPILFALAHPQFALIFPVGLCVFVASLTRKGSMDVQSRTLFRCWCLFGILSFLVSAYVLSHLALLPRYFLLPLFSSIAAVSIWLGAGTWGGRTWARVATAAALVIAALVGQMISNKSPLYAERVLASSAWASSEVIHTDPETAFRGGLLFEWANVAGKISTDAPGSGDLFLYNPKLAGEPTPRNRQIDTARYTPGDHWIAQQQFVEQPSVFGRMLVTLGLAGQLPTAIVRRITAPNPPVTLYRIGS